MKGTLKLNNPIKIDGKNVKELKYDSNEISATLFIEAESKKMHASGTGGNLAGAIEIDYSTHMYLGFASIIAVNPDYTFEDLERVHGRDLMEVLAIGRNFIMPSDDSDQDSSDEQSETTQESTTPQ